MKSCDQMPIYGSQVLYMYLVHRYTYPTIFTANHDSREALDFLELLHRISHRLQHKKKEKLDKTNMLATRHLQIAKINIHRL